MLESTGMRAVRWMCDTYLSEKKISAELRDRIGAQALESVMK